MIGCTSVQKRTEDETETFHITPCSFYSSRHREKRTSHSRHTDGSSLHLWRKTQNGSVSGRGGLRVGQCPHQQHMWLWLTWVNIWLCQMGIKDEGRIKNQPCVITSMPCPLKLYYGWGHMRTWGPHVTTRKARCYSRSRNRKHRII